VKDCEMTLENVRLKMAVGSALVAIMEQIRGAADRLADDFNLDNAAALSIVGRGIADQFQEPAAGSVMDGRTAMWRCRFRIYDSRKLDEPVADTDPELGPGDAGTMVIAGLPNVASTLAQIAAQFHGREQLSGLSADELTRRLRGLRPTLSRRKGQAVWRVPYDTLNSYARGTVTRGWLMRVDIQRTVEA
jgi:hypothetical protein